MTAPTVRLAMKADVVMCARAMTAPPAVRLAVVGTTRQWSADRDGAWPALLVSYVYLNVFLRKKHGFQYRDWSMDSGAYSAHNSGKVVELAGYIDTCKRLTAEDEKLVEVFALDVIGDWRAGLRNTETMWSQGVEAIPTYHPGEPESLLVGLARDYPKIALGGVVGWPKAKKEAFVGQCFARVWPCKIHGLGMTGEDLLMRYPFHSVDASNWETAACCFGNWATYGKMSIRGSRQDLRVEVDHYLRLEKRVRSRWAQTWARYDDGKGKACAKA